ncbi:MAG: hypothetical protein VX910_08555 [Candidatus Latescibacterota bacterium]|nr:hypothetical protein [Candidatus Latescibacterota bacterium]
MTKTYTAAFLNAYTRDMVITAKVTSHIVEEVVEVLLVANLVNRDFYCSLRIPMYGVKLRDAGIKVVME